MMNGFYCGCRKGGSFSEELEDISSKLTKLTESLSMSLGETRLAAILTKRKRLEEDEDSESSAGYQTSRWKTAEPDFSDVQIRLLSSIILD